MNLEILEQLGEKLKPALEAFASQMGVGLEHVYTIGMREMMFRGVMSCFFAVAIGILIYFLFRYLFKKIEDSCDSKFWIFAVIFISIIFLPIGSRLFYEGLHFLINPEYMLMREIIELIK